jgi:hypothetical protein
MFDPCGLHSVQSVRCSKSFNCKDFSLNIAGRDLAGFDRFTVHMNRTSTALGDAATVFWTSNSQLVTQNPKEGHIGFNIYVVLRAVNCDFHGFSLLNWLV